MTPPTLEIGIQALLAGDPRAAKRLLVACLEEAPFHPIAHFNLAVANRLLGWLPDALGHARVASEELESCASHALYGVHLHLARRRREARVEFERALALDPGSRLAAMYLALLDREEGRRDEAILGLRRALERGPGELSLLVAERIEGQLFDLRRADPGPVEVSWCAVNVVTEVMLTDGAVLRFGTEHPRTSRGVLPAPARTVSSSEVAALLHGAASIVVLTGAGLSAASGLPTRKELWRRHDRDAAVSAIGVATDPTSLWEALRDMLDGPVADPNPAHDVIARLPRVRAILTQNVDSLHQRAALPGGPPVIELHGTLERVLCGLCGRTEPGDARYHAFEASTRCACGGGLRPDVVLFGEQVRTPDLDAAVAAARACDVLLVVGCAMDVAPASELPRLASAVGARVIELKLEPSRISDAVGSHVLLGPCADTLPEIYTHLAALEILPPLPERPPVVPADPRAGRAVRVPDAGGPDPTLLVSEIYRQQGERVERYDPLAVIDTDKASVDLCAPFGGIVRKVAAQPGDEVHVGAPLFWIEQLEPVPPPPASTGEIVEASRLYFAPSGPVVRPARDAIRGLDHAHWLRPEPGVDPTPAVWAHCDALEVPRLAVWISDDPAGVLDHWTSMWRVPGRPALRTPDPLTIAWREAWRRARAEATVPYNERLRLQRLMCERVERRLSALHPRADSVERYHVLCGIDDVAKDWLARLLAPSDRPCPFTPLMDLLANGAWPFALPGGFMGVYLPRDGLPIPGFGLFADPALHDAFAPLSTIPEPQPAG